MLLTVAGFKGGVGKTTTAIHLAYNLSKQGETLLIDGDPNRSATGWASRGELPFKVVDVMAAARHAPKFEHVVIDTAARPDRSELEALVDGCDLLVLPTTPEMMAIDAMVQTAELLQELGSDRYRVLLTMTPTGATETDESMAREALGGLGLPLLAKGIRSYKAYKKASLAGVAVCELKGDAKARIACSDYVAVGAEIEEILSNG
jgi:chromosome partitioning protein